MRPAATGPAWRAALLVACVGGARPAHAGSDDWAMYNKSFDGQRFSSLTEINVGNAASLTEVCRIQIAKGGSFHSGPVVIDQIMYVTTAHETFALDPTNCRLRWRATHLPEKTEVWRTNRGVAYLDGKLFRGTADGRLLALDARTGRQLWRVAAGAPERGEFLSSAPIAAAGLVFIGTAGGDWGIHGKMLAFEAATGAEVWRFNTIPLPHEPGFDSWPSAAVARQGGGGTWSSFALDQQARELFVPVGNPAPNFSPSHRPGANLYTNSVVVLDSLTGKLKWWYQLTPNDGHDLDLGAAPLLYRNAQGAQVVALAGKDGFVHLIDRATHRLLARTPVTTISNAGGAPTRAGVRACPGAFGGVEWNGPALDSARDTLFVGAVDWCATFKSGPPAYTAGEVYAGGSYQQDAAAPSGWISALNATTGKIRWRYHAQAPVVAGVTATAAGVVFAGDMNGNFLVLESATGKALRQYDTGGAIAGGIISYAIGARQYVATTSGNVSRTTFGVLGAPSIVILTLARNMPGAATRADISRQTQAGLGFDGEPRARWRDQLRAWRIRIAAWRDGWLGGTQAAQRAAAASVAHGQALFAENCAGCHGRDRGGVSGPSLVGLGRRMSLEQTIQAIKYPAAPMPRLYPTLLTDADVTSVATFLQQSQAP